MEITYMRLSNMVDERYSRSSSAIRESRDRWSLCLEISMPVRSVPTTKDHCQCERREIRRMAVEGFRYATL